jgi:hypothetical protein
MESSCNYISSHGIPQKCDIFIRKLQDIDTYVDKSFQDGTTIYIKVDFIRHFSKILLPKIQYTFILISGLSDYTIPYNLFPENEVEPFINNPKMIHWYVCNCAIEHVKITKIPLGLDYHTLSNQSTFWGNQEMPIYQEMKIAQVLDIAKTSEERKLQCYSNFHFAIYGERFGYSRKDVIDRVPKEIVYYEPEKTTRLQSWKNQVEYAFVISPHGNGLDTHRTWEALVLGCIVIVKKSPLDCLYQDLPVVILDDWSELTQELLEKTKIDFSVKTFNYKKLELSYWIDKIKSTNIPV